MAVVDGVPSTTAALTPVVLVHEEQHDVDAPIDELSLLPRATRPIDALLLLDEVAEVIVKGLHRAEEVQLLRVRRHRRDGPLVQHTDGILAMRTKRQITRQTTRAETDGGLIC